MESSIWLWGGDFSKMIRIKRENRNIYSVKEAFNCRSAYIFINYIAWIRLLSSNLHVAVQFQWGSSFSHRCFHFSWHSMRQPSHRKTKFHFWVCELFAYYLCLFAVIGHNHDSFFFLALCWCFVRRHFLFVLFKGISPSIVVYWTNIVASFFSSISV